MSACFGEGDAGREKGKKIRRLENITIGLEGK
jgi:hypothetical protein